MTSSADTELMLQMMDYDTGCCDYSSSSVFVEQRCAIMSNVPEVLHCAQEGFRTSYPQRHRIYSTSRDEDWVHIAGLSQFIMTLISP